MSARVLFVTSNGTGLGHLTRSMAIARRLAPGLEPLVLTLSGAAPVVAEQGFPVEYVASYSTPTAGSDWRWSRRLRGRLRAVLREAEPAVLVFDGAHPYQALIDALPAAPGMHRVWCRRPMWRAGSNPGALERTRFFDRVLEPGEFAAAEDRGATVARRGEVHPVAPIVFCADDELLPREQAERELGIEPGGVNVLVQLGQGDEVAEATRRCLRHLAGREGVRVAALRSALAAFDEPPPGVVELRATYPVSRYLRAFDVAVSAAGYNAFHELVRFGVPTLFIPMPRQTDDQAARARHVQGSGAGRGVEGPGSGEIEARLDELLDASQREAARRRLAELRPANGAEEAAGWLAELARSERERRPGASPWRRYARHPLTSARAAAPFAARVPAAVANLARQTITRPPARTLVLGLGLEADALAAEVEAALAAGPDPPERVLVVTDALAALPALRRLGVGLEHVPASEAASALGAGGDRLEFVRSRLGLILAERPRPRRAIGLGPDAREALAGSGLSPAA